MIRTLNIIVLFAILVLFSCRKEDEKTPEQIERDKIIATENLLRDNTWGFQNFQINVLYESRAIPILANVADENGMVQAGLYDSYDIFGDAHRQEYYSYQFSRDNINQDTSGYGDYHKFAGYFIINTEEIWMNANDAGPMRFQYEYLEDEGVFQMTTDHARNEKIVNAINQMIANTILSGKPGDIANVVIDKILGNDKIYDAIQQVLYDVIHGKIDEIAQNPEEIANKLAELIIQKLKEIDWETIVYDKLVEILEALKIENPEEKATELAVKIADKIETSISQEDIYDIILPILQDFENETLPKLVPILSDAIYKLISTVLSVENIYDKVHPLWTEFTQVDSTKIIELSDTLGTVITNHFLDSAELTATLTPFVELIDATPNLQLPNISQDIIDNVLTPKVDSINANFPGLELDPKWDIIKPVITTALRQIKQSIGDQTIEEASASLAHTIINLMDFAISKGLEAALFRLQDVPAENASTILAGWISNLVEMAEPQIVAFLESKLNELIELFNAEDIAENLSALMHAKIIEVYSAENISDLILPLIQALSDINIEAAAKKITDWLFELGIIKDNIDEDVVLEKLTEILSQLIGQINVEETSQRLVDLILQSDIVTNIDGTILKRVLEIKIYQFLVNLGKDINAIDKIEFTLIRK